MKYKIFYKSVIAITLMFLAGCSTTKSPSADEEKKIATARINDQLGIAYLERHNIQHAKQKFITALDEAPNVPETWYSMAYFLEITGDKKQAKEYYLKAIAISDNGESQNNYGTFLCRSGEYQEAIKHFELAVKDLHYVDTGAAYENAGLCALKIPNNSLAIQYFDKALLADPDRSLSSMELAQIYYKEGKYKKSKLYLEQFLQLSSPTQEAYKLSDALDKKLGEKYLI